VHSLYTHPEIFLRELVSNASDALNKVRVRRLTDNNIVCPEEDLRISIDVDKDKELFSIEDTGIGMTSEELVAQIGTIAKSGTLEFLKKMQQQPAAIDGQLIGQFGVGFYSVFMVTDEINVETRSAEPSAEACLWRSSGEEKFTISPSSREKRGTRIFFKLKDEHKEFYEPSRIKAILKKYSNFVDFPIYVNGEEINKVSALWHRKKEDITTEELNEFYKFITNDFEEPLGHLHLAIEGNLNFKALLFIPKSAPPMLFRDANEKSLQLYSKKVFIQDDCKELLPDYLRFLRGVVDTEDLPLNVSREVTQSSPVTAKINNVITGKVLGLLSEWADNEPEKYDEFFKNFGQMFKIGINSDYSHRDKIIELVRFESSKLEAGKITSLKDYVSRMKPEQTEIYYISGETRERIERNPNLEYFRKKDYEVLYLLDPVDIFTVPYIHEYDKKPLKSTDKADIKLTKDEEMQIDSLSPEIIKSLIDVFKKTLGDAVEDVVESKRLVDSPVTLVAGSHGMDAQMEKMMQIIDKNFSGSKRILEINPSHPLIKSLAKRALAGGDDPILRDCINLLFGGASLLEEKLQSPAEFVSKLNDMLLNAVKE